MKKKKSDFEESATAKLARRLGIELDYINAAGKRIVVAVSPARSTLNAQSSASLPTGMKVPRPLPGPKPPNRSSAASAMLHSFPRHDTR